MCLFPEPTDAPNRSIDRSPPTKVWRTLKSLPETKCQPTAMASARANAKHEELEPELAPQLCSRHDGQISDDDTPALEHGGPNPWTARGARVAASTALMRRRIRPCEHFASRNVQDASHDNKPIRSKSYRRRQPDSGLLSSPTSVGNKDNGRGRRAHRHLTHKWRLLLSGTPRCRMCVLPWACALSAVLRPSPHGPQST